MAAHAAQLVEAVLPRVSVRQWVLTLPYRLRYRLAWDHGLTRAVLSVYARVLQDFYSRSAHQHGYAKGRTGMVTVIQRFGSGVNLNVHFHTLVLDGVFIERTQGRLEFHAAMPPSDAAVTQVLAAIRHRVRRLLARRGLEADAAELGPLDGLAEVSPILAQILSASVQGRVALGEPAGTRVARLGGVPPVLTASARGPRQAHLDGFDLHANVRVPPNDRARLEHLCRYLLRPPLVQDRVRLRADGRLAVKLKAAWRDGTTHLVFEPLEFLGKLAALTPRPEINLVLYHGVLAPHAHWRPQVVSYGRAAPEAAVLGPAETRQVLSPPPCNWTWAALMRRAFAIDVLACPNCGGPMRVIATVEDPLAVRQILAAQRVAEPPGPSPPGGASTMAT
jgi:hypothetical protein